VEGLLSSFYQAIDAQISVTAPPPDKRGMEYELCGLEVPSLREMRE